MQKLFSALFKSKKPDRDNIADSISDDPHKAAYNKLRAPSNHHSACFAPSVNMLFATDGTVKACCHNSENILGQYPMQSISEIWNSEAAKVFRENLRDFKFLSGCSGCARDFVEGHYDQMPAMHFDTLPRSADYPTMMEFLISNTFNLECIMCSGELSSSIRKNREKLPALKSNYGPDFVDQLQEFIPHLKETRFSGAGEAFSIDIYYSLWRTLTERNPECLLVVQTNGTVLNARVRDHLESGNFQIGVSLDSLKKETFEAIRLNASFESVMQNIAYFAAYSHEKGRVFTISTCVMRQNWQEMPDFVRYCNEIGAHIIFHKVWSPLSCALYNLSSSELNNIHSYLSSFSFPADTPLEKRNSNTYKYFVSVIERWMKDAVLKEQSGAEWQALSDQELQTNINASIQSYIQEQTMIESDREQLIELCISKFARVMDMWTDQNDKRKILLKISSIPVSEMIISLKVQPLEKLYEMSKTNQN
jgi:MoaA/NifB/PqqE/SkfB family radical SAM enzyme